MAIMNFDYSNERAPRATLSVVQDAGKEPKQGSFKLINPNHNPKSS
jgi:hypothetical protein